MTTCTRRGDRRAALAARRLVRTALVTAAAAAIATFLAGIALPGVVRTAYAPGGGLPKSQIARVKDAVDVFRITFGSMPESLDDLRNPPDGSEPLLANDPIDPWGHPYVLKRLDGTDYDILSYGADGEPGGEGEKADLSYTEGVLRHPDAPK